MKAKYILTAVFSAALLSSCSDFLDVQKEGEPTTTLYFTNDDQAVDAIDALYAPIHQEGLFGRELYWEQGGACDIVWGRTRSYPTLPWIWKNESRGVPAESGSSVRHRDSWLYRLF